MIWQASVYNGANSASEMDTPDKVSARAGAGGVSPAFRWIFFGLCGAGVALVVLSRAIDPGRAATAIRRAGTPNHLDMNVEEYANELLRDGDLVWVEWLTRSDHGGSYLRALERRTIGWDKSGYQIDTGTKFVFKAPDQPARVFMADRPLRISNSKKNLPSSADAVVHGTSALSEPVVPWSGDVYLFFATYTEIKKDWTDGEFIEVDWASGGFTGDVGRAYIRIVNGRMISARDGIFLMGGARYKIMPGTVFDIKVPNLAVERHTASQNIFIAKSGWPPIGDLQPFFAK